MAASLKISRKTDSHVPSQLVVVPLRSALQHNTRLRRLETPTQWWGHLYAALGDRTLRMTSLALLAALTSTAAHPSTL